MRDKTSVPTDWFKSSFSSPSQSCVEVRFAGEQVHVRDSKLRDTSPIMTFGATQWVALINKLDD